MPRVQTETDSKDWSSPINTNETRRVTVRKLKDTVFVDLREHYFDKEGNPLPGKKGLCLTSEQFETLISMVDQIRQEVKKLG